MQTTQNWKNNIERQLSTHISVNQCAKRVFPFGLHDQMFAQKISFKVARNENADFFSICITICIYKSACTLMVLEEETNKQTNL